MGAGEGVCEPQESSHRALHVVVQLSRHRSPAGAGSQVPGGRRVLGYREPEAEGHRGAAGPLPRGPLDEATSWPEVSPEQSRPDEGNLGNGRPSAASALGRQTPDSPAPSFLVAATGHCSWLGMWESRAGAQRPQTPGAGKLPRPHYRPVCLHLQDHSTTGLGLKKAGLLPPLSSAPLIGSPEGEGDA